MQLKVLSVYSRNMYVEENQSSRFHEIIDIKDKVPGLTGR